MDHAGLTSYGSWLHGPSSIVTPCIENHVKNYPQGGFMHTKVSSLMKYNPEIISPEMTLKEAARRMDKLNCGVLPVGTFEELVGMITDRDIVIRAIANGKNVAREKVKDYMSSEVYYCDIDDTLEHAAKLMHDNHVSRLVVKDTNGEVAGILSFGCILRNHKSKPEMSNVIEFATGQKIA
jgi:CBS domain-containing protein